MRRKIDYSDNPPLTREQILSGRHPTPEEVELHRRSIEKFLGVPRPPRGRPPKHPSHKYRPVFMRLHPRALAWAKEEARRRGIGYQTAINELILKQPHHPRHRAA